MKLHQRGIDLLLNVQDALSLFDRLSAKEAQDLLRETEVVLRDLLARDKPPAEPIGGDDE